MLFGTTLVASLVVMALSAPAAAQNAVPWEDGQPRFQSRDAPAQGNTARQDPEIQDAFHERRRGYSQPRWRSEPRSRRYEQRRSYGRRDPWWWGGERRRQRPQQGPAELGGGPRPSITPAAPAKVSFENNEPTGTIVIDSEARRLYYTLSKTEAYEYPVSVGREGYDWYGTETVSRVASWPDWHPPAEMREREPQLPKKMTGGMRNPLGAKALYLGDTLYRIHGTNETSTIGQAASSGCFRMTNEDVVHLASLVETGTTVRVVRSWPDGELAQADETESAGASAQ